MAWQSWRLDDRLEGNCSSGINEKAYSYLKILVWRSGRNLLRLRNDYVRNSIEIATTYRMNYLLGMRDLRENSF